jgi:hypothetical protein
MIRPKQGTKQRVLQQLLFVVNRLAAACQRFAYSHVWSSRVVAPSMRVARTSLHCWEILKVGPRETRHPMPAGEILRSPSFRPHIQISRSGFSNSRPWFDRLYQPHGPAVTQPWPYSAVCEAAAGHQEPGNCLRES